MVGGIIIGLGAVWTAICCLYQRRNEACFASVASFSERRRRRRTYAHIAMEE